jgi:transketolase
MSATASPASLLDRIEYRPEGGAYLNLMGAPLEAIPDIDEVKIAEICRVARGLLFTAVEAAQSGHPGGSSSKAEQVVTLLLSGALRFDAANPKHPGRDRVVWSAGHCSPLFHAVLALIYGNEQELLRFRRWGGPSGHVESTYPLADTSTGASGHGFSAGLGFALLHRGCGLETRAWVIGGDAESEEGMSYEARNVAATLGARNLIVTMDYNTFGIDGPITETMAGPYLSHWVGHGWNVIEVDGHNVRELAHAYRLAAQGFGGERPTVVMCHTVKGLHYGRLAGSADSHGMPLKHEEYVSAMTALGFAAGLPMLGEAERQYLQGRLAAIGRELPSEAELVGRMEKALGGRPMADYRTLERPAELPAELVFPEGESVATRKATEAWFAWAMKHSAFFFVGAGDLMKSILTGKAEQVYGVVSPENVLGRGFRFGIAEQNMAMMSTAMAQDTLPGGFRPFTAFASYGVFTSMMANSVRMTLINSDLNPSAKAFFVVLAAHDGPETGEDGPTHHGLFWMSLFTAYPGIKVYKPLDANEAVEMLFLAAKRGEPVAFSAVRPGTPVFRRGDGVPAARAACDGAYVFKAFRDNDKPKKVYVVSGGQVMANLLSILPELERRYDVKIIAVTSPELFEELRRTDPEKADGIFPDGERQYVVTLHNGWPGWLFPFLLPADYCERTIAMDRFSRSGKPDEIYRAAGFDAAGLRKRLLG